LRFPNGKAYRDLHYESDRIEIHPKVMLGKPVIRGTRIPVELLTRKLGYGMTQADLLDAYPRLTQIDIDAAFESATNHSDKPNAEYSNNGTRSC
jgi:uncharacterized protein (DUF433 family)